MTIGSESRPWLALCATLVVGVLVAGGADAAAVKARGPRLPRRERPARCPPTEPRSVAPPTWAAARSELAPHGADAIRLCRYNGLSTPPRLALARASLQVKRRVVARLVRELDTLPAIPPGPPIPCPPDDASQIVALLGYPNGRRVTIAIGLTGCTFVTNGSVSRLASRQLLADLERLLSLLAASTSVPRTRTPCLGPSQPGGVGGCRGSASI